MTDWLMVIITAIYVIATIFICVFNGKSAKVANDQSIIAQKQMKEMINQYNAVNRPIVSVRFDIVRSGLLCFIIENEGPLSAKNVRVRINDAFINNVEDNGQKSRIFDLNQSSFYLASHQRITVLLGGQASFTSIADEKALIDIFYDGFEDHTEIDISQYKFLIVYDSSVEDISQHLKKMKENDAKFQKSLIKAIDKPPPVQNVIVQDATDDALKFKVFKFVCMEKNQTAEQIANQMHMDQNKVFDMLVELNKVDRLVAYTFHEVTEDDKKAL